MLISFVILLWSFFSIVVDYALGNGSKSDTQFASIMMIVFTISLIFLVYFSSK